MNIVVLPRPTAALIPVPRRKARPPEGRLSGVAPPNPDIQVTRTTQGPITALSVLRVDRRPSLATPKDNTPTVVVEATRTAEEAVRLEVTAITLASAARAATGAPGAQARPTVGSGLGDAPALTAVTRPQEALTTLREAIHRRRPVARLARERPAE